MPNHYFRQCNAYCRLHRPTRPGKCDAEPYPTIDSKPHILEVLLVHPVIDHKNNSLKDVVSGTFFHHYSQVAKPEKSPRCKNIFKGSDVHKQYFLFSCRYMLVFSKSLPIVLACYIILSAQTRWCWLKLPCK